ncbi:MAG: hypothetical protein J6S15_03445 [Clostridia bacterium]|nr:hypothetical protein [Clostridia bacterium]
MNKTQLFQFVFRVKLEALGFRVKQGMAYRVNGEILQGLALQSIPDLFFIRYTQLPYWCYRLAFSDLPMDRLYWASEGGVASPSETFFREDAENNKAGMERCYEHFITEVFPVMEQTYDEKTFLELPKRILPGRPTEQYSLLHLSYLQGNWGYAKEWLNNRKAKELQLRDSIFEKQWASVFPRDEKEVRIFENNFRATYEKQKSEIPSSVDRTMMLQYKLVFDKIADNDLNWISAVYETEKEFVRQQLKAQLKITV